jgi:hypothetical protein
MGNSSTVDVATHSYSIAPGVVVQIHSITDAVDFVGDLLDELDAMAKVTAMKEVANGEMGQATLLGLAHAQAANVRHIRGIMPCLVKAALATERVKHCAEAV